MKKTRFEALPKDDRDKVQRYVATHPETHTDLEELFRESWNRLVRGVTGLRTRPVRSGYAYQSEADLFACETGMLASELIQRGIVKRLQEDSPEALASHLFLVSRLHYVSNLAQTHAYSGTDCQHVFDLLLSVASNDTDAVNAYLCRYDYISKSGHPFTKLLCNAVRMILTRSPNDRLVSELHKRKDSSYDKATLSALAAIAEGQPQRVTENLNAMLAGHRRKTVDDAMLRYFAVLVHAIYRMASNIFPSVGLPVPPEPNLLLWDSNVQAQLDLPRPCTDLDAIGSFSPIVATWAKQLPISLPDKAIEQMFSQ